MNDVSVDRRAGAQASRLTLGSARDAGLQIPDHAGSLQTGIVHLGIGAFARAHTAVYTEAAIAASGDTSWGITAFSQRSAEVPNLLQPQDGLYAVATRGVGESRVDLVTSVREAVDGARDTAAIVAAIADPRTRVVTLTITEKGYRRSSSGSLDLNDVDVRADVAGDTRTAIGQLAAAILARAGDPITLVSCDNLPMNGAVLRGVLTDFAQARGGAEGQALRTALEHSVTTPSTMVDRMVPATTAQDLALIEQELGLRDEAGVVAEPFTQWVIEDNFAAGRPAWEAGGAQFVTDVAPWEEAKLRILNAGHTMLAYLGLLGETDTIAETVGVEPWVEAMRRMIDLEVIPTLQTPEGMNLESYRDSVTERFANPYLGHTVTKVGSDGSQKFGPRILSTMRAARERGIEPRWGALAVAAWAAYIVQADEASINDPMRATLVAATAAGPAADAGMRLLELIDPRLAADDVVRELVTGWSQLIARGGITAVQAEIHAV